MPPWKPIRAATWARSSCAGGSTGATFGEVLMLLGQEGLPLPRAPIAGREAHLARAAKLLFGERAGTIVEDDGPVASPPKS